MFGFLSAACAGATAHNSAAEAVSSDKPPVVSFRFMVLHVLWFLSLVLLFRGEV
jgi:hypothetical protein